MSSVQLGARRQNEPYGAVRDESIVVRVVEGDDPLPDGVAGALERDDRFDVETASVRANALEGLGAVDCVVDVTAPRDGGDLDLLDAVRERAPGLPYVLVADDPRRAVVDRVLSSEATDIYRVRGGSGAGDLVRKRVALVVTRERALALARRSAAAVETTREGLAVVAPDGTVQFANRLFARRLGYHRAEVVGRSWRELFTDRAVERIESDALPSVADGWRWVGPCATRGPDGGSETVSVAITRLDDDSLVFTLTDDRGGDGG